MIFIFKYKMMAPDHCPLSFDHGGNTVGYNVLHFGMHFFMIQPFCLCRIYYTARPRGVDKAIFYGHNSVRIFGIKAQHRLPVR